MPSLEPEFDERNCRMPVCRPTPSAAAGSAPGTSEETQGHAPDFPLIADSDGKVAHACGMFHPKALDTLAMRSAFVTGPDNEIKLTITCPAGTGRNFDEIPCLVDSLQLTAEHSVATPVNWREGEDFIIVPSLSDDDAKRKFPQGWKTLEPCLRGVGQAGQGDPEELRSPLAVQGCTAISSA